MDAWVVRSAGIADAERELVERHATGDVGAFDEIRKLFAQSPPFAHLAAVYRTFDWNGPLKFSHRASGLSDRVWGSAKKAAE